MVNNRDEDGTMRTPEHCRNKKNLRKQTLAEPIAIVIRRRRLESIGHIKRRRKQKTSEQCQNEGGKRPGGRPRWKNTFRRDLKPGTSGRNEPLTEKDGKVSARPATPAQGEGGER